MVSKTTEDIQIDVEVAYVPEESSPKENRYFFAYFIKMTNLGNFRAKLKTREWLITDAQGRVEIVKGAGVVGQYPDLSPSESFEYNSFCPLETSMGSMKGFYYFEREDGEEIKVEIPEFDLISGPMTIH